MKKQLLRGHDSCWRCRLSMLPDDGYKGGCAIYKIKYKNPERYPHLIKHKNRDIPVFICESCHEILKKESA